MGNRMLWRGRLEADSGIVAVLRRATEDRRSLITGLDIEKSSQGREELQFKMSWTAS